MLLSHSCEEKINVSMVTAPARVSGGQDQFPASLTLPSLSGQLLGLCLAPLPIATLGLLAHILIIGRYLRCLWKYVFFVVIHGHCKNLWLTENAKREYIDFKYMDSNRTQ